MKNRFLIFFITGLICLLLALLNILLWLNLSIRAQADFETTRSAYLSFFPDVLRNAKLLTGINILLLVVASILFYKVQFYQRLSASSRFLFVGTVILAAWQVFSLM